MKKILTVLFAVVAICALATASAFAAESSAPIEIGSEDVIAEISPDASEGLQTDALEGEEPLLGGTLVYIDELCVSISSSAFTDVVKRIEGGHENWTAINFDLNDEAGMQSDYVYIGYHKSYGFTSWSSDARPITGLLIVANVPNPLQDPTDVTWQGKTYHPVTETFNGSQSTVDLNSGTGNVPTYLYYTDDDWDTGAPLLTGIELTQDYDPANGERKLDYVYLHDMYGQNEYDPASFKAYPHDVRGASGTYITPRYLLGTYHKHSIESSFDEWSHCISCTGCNFRIEKEHEPTVTNMGGYHRVSCSGCERSVDEPHADKNHDNACDACGCRFAVSADGLYFGSFPEAWAYAVEARYPVTITLLETMDANENSNGESVDLAIPMLEGVDITIKGVPGAKLIVSQDLPILMWNGTLKVNVEVESVCEDSIRIFAALAGKIILGKNGSITITKASSLGPEIMPGLTNAPIMAAGAGAIETEGGSITFRNRVEGSAGISMPYAIEKSTLVVDDTAITGADTAILVEGDVDATIYGGRFDAGEGCALKVGSVISGSTVRAPEVSIAGGEFIGATCVDVDAACALSITEGIFKGAFTGKNVAECMIEGASAAEIDADGNITKLIDTQTLADAGDSYTFAERTWIGLSFGGGGDGGNEGGEGGGLAETGDGGVPAVLAVALLAAAAGLALAISRRRAH